MKTLKGISLVFVAAVFMVSCKQTSNEQKETPVNQTETTSVTDISGTMQKATFQIEGMSCAIGCAKVIEGKLAKMEGIQNAKVDFDSKTATLEFDNAKQNTESIKKMVEEIANGAYKVENMSVVKDLAMVDQDDKTTQKKCCSSHKDGKSCGDKKATNDKKGCCKDKKAKKDTPKQNII
ncbi:Cu+-exporting ATPase [Paenimyroides aquimaris]|uniref:Cu+-exporting ATPase n=1 Tax=Paenimyroides marinum TaxID=1159016 RepID=A0A1H6KQC0_9FLAO|nr:heavy-metal-associated domain-containing protein [Paenimyroides aquimaris]SEH75056.1 Cu+-exporting ATPase [Paenimyroides aquimaris]